MSENPEEGLLWQVHTLNPDKSGDVIHPEAKITLPPGEYTIVVNGDKLKSIVKVAPSSKVILQFRPDHEPPDRLHYFDLIQLDNMGYSAQRIRELIQDYARVLTLKAAVEKAVLEVTGKTLAALGMEFYE